METEEQVVLVDGDDHAVGTMGKIQAHREGQLHRALSVFVFNNEGELLLQKRADSKYHSPGLWTNTSCSHPRPGENIADAASRRLAEEMGMSCALTFVFSFTYRSELDQGMIEHEIDHVFVGRTDDVPEPDSSEVSDWAYADLEEIRNQIETTPDRFTSWFPLCFERVIENISGSLQHKPS